jgi:hypothetical protein
MDLKEIARRDAVRIAKLLRFAVMPSHFAVVRGAKAKRKARELWLGGEATFPEN